MNAGHPRRWLAVGALVLSVLAVGIDATVLSLALPTLARALHASASELQWFVTAYTLVFAAGMIPAGMLGDRFGRKTLLLAGLVIFGVSSLAAAYAPSTNVFVAARAVLGLGGAIIAPMVLGVLPVLFGEEERRKAIAVVAAATMLGYPIGPILGGWLLVHFWWGAVFLINVPVVVLGLAAVVAWLPESRSPRPKRLDAWGIAASSAGLASLTYGVIEAGQYGWGDVTAVLPLIGGAGVLAVFVLCERRVPEPLVDLALFRAAGYSWGTALMTLVSFAMFGVLFVMPQYFQAILGTDAMGAGIRLLPLIGGLAAGSAVVDRLARVIGANVAVGTGFGLLAVGLFYGTTTSVTSTTALSATWTVICGFGLGLAMPAAMDAALGTLPEEASSVGSGVLQAVRMVGGSFGAAILGSVLNSGYRDRLDLTGLPGSAAAAVRGGVFDGIEAAGRLRSAPLLNSVRTAFVDGMDVTLWACGGIAVTSAVLALIVLPRRSAEPGAARRPGPPQRAEHDTPA